MPPPSRHVATFRRALQEPSSDAYRPLAEQLYGWLVAPYAEDLAEAKVSTLVFVPDGPLRTIPMAALSDGTRYLGERFALAITPSLALDGTVYTDFAQVEVDDQQVNLDRFNLFYPEKRPFFLENAGLFAVGNPGEVELFFSRRIGLSADGQQIPILWGSRLSGKAGPYNIGALDMQAADSGAAPSNNFAVVRTSRALPNRSAYLILVSSSSPVTGLIGGSFMLPPWPWRARRVP